MKKNIVVNAKPAERTGKRIKKEASDPDDKYVNLVQNDDKKVKKKHGK